MSDMKKPRFSAQQTHLSRKEGEARMERRVSSASTRGAGRAVARGMSSFESCAARPSMRSVENSPSRQPSSRSLKIKWRDDFLAGGQRGIQVRDPDQRADFIQDLKTKNLKTKNGDQTMTIELLEKKINQLEEGLRFPQRRPSR